MPEAVEPVLDIHNLEFGYDQESLINIEKFTLSPGEKVAVIGPSGCGKTTLMHLLAGLIKPRQGVIKLAGQDITQLGEQQIDRLRGREVGIVFQNLHLMPAISILDNLLLAQKLARVDVDKAHAMELLARLGIADKANVLPSALSQGQAQRAAIARAVVHKPKLVIGDEPTSALDRNNANEAIQLLTELATSINFALLIVTHDERVSDAMDKVVRLGETS
jgi:putative ABC transport system ATP-binding protein